ncbi:MAG: Fe-S-oxidoreductase [Desulfuromonas sp.]|nr:MAG: Fe-S-oxidoreductase [Desulfuromonas sp.]
MKRHRGSHCDVERPSTWVSYRAKLCRTCQATCCSLPVEVRIDDLVRMKLVDPFDAGDPPKQLARRLQKQGMIEHFNFKNQVYTLARRADGDCIFLDPSSRRCTVYSQRPATCRNHPQVGPRPGYCAYREQVVAEN